jgi:hypothetical protein
MSMNDSATPEEKKKPGWFASCGIFTIVWFLVLTSWFIFQHFSGFTTLPSYASLLFERFRYVYNDIDTETLILLNFLNLVGYLILVLLPTFLIQRGIIKLFWKKHSN